MISNEQQILKIIKYSPSVLILILSIICTLSFYYENKKTFLETKNNIEENYISANKKEIKEEIYQVYSFIKKLQETTEIELKNSIKDRVYEAHTIATSIYERYKNSKSKEEILDIIKTTLKDIRFNSGRGYFFMVDDIAISLLQPSKKELENKNLYEYEDENGYKLMQTIVKTIEEKTERYDQYYWKNPNSTENSSKKISFYKYFEPLNLAIGSGEYVDDYEKEIQKKALEYINLIRFDNDKYIFIVDYNGTFISHVKGEYIGKNVITINNTENIKKVTNDLIEISKNGEGFYSYIQKQKPSTNLPSNKISFVKGINNWKWMIGTGFYEDEIKEIVKKKEEEVNKKFDDYVKKIIVFSISLTFILLFISKYISKYLENKFNAYKNESRIKQDMLYQQSKMAAMGEMIGNIAHQWRQPLSTISTASTGILVSKELGILEDSTLEYSLSRINTSAQYLSKTIDDFRNFFNPNKVKNLFLLKDSVKTTLELISGQFESQNIQIIENIEDIKINSYENELIQALINILNNAKDALKDKDLTQKLIFICAFQEKDMIIIKIKDNAGGIQKEIIDKIFEPYFTTKHKAQGTGIGLYMTQEIIVKHLKGMIKVENDEFLYENISYVGALFTIELPLDI